MEFIGNIIVPAILAAVGLAIMIVPPKRLLSLDRQTGYWFYKRTLESTNDEVKAIRAAGIFYKIFGAVFTLFALASFL